MNTPDHKVDEMRQSIAKEASALADAQSRAHQAERDARAQLAALETELDQLMVDLFMGRSTDAGRQFQLHTEIRGCELRLADLGRLAKGFAAESARAEGRSRQLRVMERAVQTYGDLKDRIETEGALAGLVEDLKLWARKLDCTEDAEDFLSELQQETVA